MFYDGTKLLSLSDINGNKPEIYICTSNRSAGKTTYFNRLCVNKFLEKNEKFAVLFRFVSELDNCDEIFFKDIGQLFFKNYVMTSQKCSSGAYYELYINDDLCGYAIALNSADKIKRFSHLLSDTQRIVFDEFQSETGNYCADEVSKFISIHTSLARGQGKQSRYLPVYMISNHITILNPYYIELGITNRLTKDTHFMRGDGWVLESGFNESAANAQANSAFNKAFSANKQFEYNTSGKYLLDNDAFVEKPNGKNIYLATVKYGNKYYAIREYTEQGILYCDKNVDMTFPFKIALDTDSHTVNYIMLTRNSPVIFSMRNLFEKGCFRFKDLECKDVILKLLSYGIRTR